MFANMLTHIRPESNQNIRSAVYRAAAFSATSSASVNGRTAPTARSPSCTGPNPTRTSRVTGCPTALIILRTWRFLPSLMRSSTIERPPSRLRSPVPDTSVAFAGAVRPSLSSAAALTHSAVRSAGLLEPLRDPDLDDRLARDSEA